MSDAHSDPSPPGRPAVFLDRDGTIIRQVHHLRRARDVALLPGAASAMRRLQGAGHALVVVTNQSAVGRGLLSEVGLAQIHEELFRQLSEASVHLDGIYYSTAVPDGPDRRVVEHPDRKPGPGMLLTASSELGLDLGRSWMIGDRVSDLLAGRNAGCLGTLLVRTGYGRSERVEPGLADRIVADLTEATEWILSRGPAP